MLSQGVIQHLFIFGIGKNSVCKTISEKGVDSFAELVFIVGDDENTSIVGVHKFIASLYDPKGKENEAHSNMNVLRAKLAAKRECVLAKLPPCDESETACQKGCLANMDLDFLPHC